MKISDDHFLEKATRDIIAGGNAMPVRRALVIHFTSGATAKSSVDFWKTPAAKGASAHIIIDRDGSIIQCRAFDKTCGHAGVSRWVDPKTGKRYRWMNTYTIGIELANAGDDAGLARKWSKLPLIKARHRNGGAVVAWEQYPAVQVAACFEVAKALVLKYRLDDITGHDCIAPERKNDPGPAFPMEQLREYCGFSGLPVVHEP